LSKGIPVYESVVLPSPALPMLPIWTDEGGMAMQGGAATSILKNKDIWDLTIQNVNGRLMVMRERILPDQAYESGRI
jgi:hypothetical protein